MAYKGRYTPKNPKKYKIVYLKKLEPNMKKTHTPVGNMLILIQD